MSFATVRVMAAGLLVFYVLACLFALVFDVVHEPKPLLDVIVGVPATLLFGFLFMIAAVGGGGALGDMTTMRLGMLLALLVTPFVTPWLLRLRLKTLGDILEVGALVYFARVARRAWRREADRG